jgi:hypothetical protein
MQNCIAAERAKIDERIAWPITPFNPSSDGAYYRRCTRSFHAQLVDRFHLG